MSLKIDSHQHFWEYDPDRYSWIDKSLKSLRRDFVPKDLNSLLEKHGFDGCIAVQADQSEAETEFLLKAASENSFVKGVVGWTDLKSPDLDKRLSVYTSNPLFKGLRHTVYDEKGEFMLDEKFQKGISRLQVFGLTYDILAFDYQLASATDLVGKFPEQPFVLDHMGKPKLSGRPEQEWVKNIKALGSCRNVHCKLSGFLNGNYDPKGEIYKAFLDVIFNAFGEDRLIFGSDWPVCLAAGSYADTVRVVENYLSDSSYASEKIFGKNATAFYDLQE